VFDDTKALDDLVRNLWLLAFGVLVVNPVLVFVVTRWPQRRVRRHGRRGHWFAALAVVIAAEVAAVVIVILFADGISVAAVLWLAVSTGVMALVLVRLVALAVRSTPDQS
jgi:hypothetical protein